MSDARTILKQYWGYDHFRPLQEDIVNAVIRNEDVLALLPTGGGKSICFQVPALMKPGVCLVVSPLIALINDQVENLNQRGISAIAIHSGLSYREVKKAMEDAASGRYKFVYLSPERLESRLFLEYLPAMQTTLIAIDEAHCISQWGYDFRPSYLKIAALRQQLPGVAIIALTASATKEVQDDICEKLSFQKKHQRFQQSFERPNIAYHVMTPESKAITLIELLKKNSGSAIVYAKSRRQTEETAALLKMHGFSADFYHAGLKKEERNKKQEDWIRNKISIIVCTNAFGMGIDKPDVRCVVHFSIPESLENYYQEAGRAGRDGKSSNVVLLFDQREADDLYQTNTLRYPEPEILKQIYAALMNHLQVPAGAGEGQTFDFDISTFANAFKLHPVQTNYVLQTLSQEGLLYLTESAYKPSQLSFTCSKEEMRTVENNYSGTVEMIRALLRNYEGIFNYPTSIFERQLAGILRITTEQVSKQLIFLHQIGIVQYKPQSEKPQLTLLRNRMYRDDYRFNMASIRKRKEKHLERIKAMIHYATDKSLCRSMMIANYFNDADAKPCEICDNCATNTTKKISKQQFEAISQIINKLASLKPVSFEEIREKTIDLEIHQVKQVLKYMQDELLILIDSEGRYSCKK